MHCASYTAHKSHIIRLITLHAFQEHGIVWTREKSLMVFRSWIIIVIYILLIAKFWCTNHPLQKTFIEGEKAITDCKHEALYSMIQIETFKAMSGEHLSCCCFETARFFHKLYIKFSHTLETFYLSGCFKCFLENPCFQLPQNVP